MLLPEALLSYLASPPGRRERSGQAHLCEALLQAEAEAEPKPWAKPEPENLRALSMAPAALPCPPILPAPLQLAQQPTRPHPTANLSPGTPAGPTSSTAAAARVGRGRSLRSHPARQPPPVPPTPPPAQLSSVFRDDCSRGGGNCLGAGTPRSLHLLSPPNTPPHPFSALWIGATHLALPLMVELVPAVTSIPPEGPKGWRASDSPKWER